MGIDYNGTPNSRSWYGRESNDTAGTRIQDDVRLIANTVASVVGGDGFRSDDYGNTPDTAYNLTAGSQPLDGLTERYNDGDVFEITPATTANWNFTATAHYGSQAQPSLELLDASDNVLAAHDDARASQRPHQRTVPQPQLRPRHLLRGRQRQR